MNCPECNEPMTSSQEVYDYVESGLPNIKLDSVEVRRCPKCGEYEALIPRIEQLHQAIASILIEKRSRLTHAEIRFLRKYLGWSGVDFARHMGVAPETVSRWENDKEPMGGTAERLLRTMVAIKEPVTDYSIEVLADISDSLRPSALHAERAKGGWLVNDAVTGVA